MGEEVAGCAEADRLGDVAGAGLELGRCGHVGRALLGDLRDHVAAAEERRHRLEQLGLAVQDADAGRPVRLVTGPGVEVDVAHVDRQVRDGLRAVDHHPGAGGVRAAGDVGDVVDRAADIGGVGDRDDLRGALEQRVELGVDQAALVVDADVGQRGPGALRRELPRDEVRVVLQLGDDDQVALGEPDRAPAVGDEVDRLGGVAGEDRLRGRRADQLRGLHASGLELLGRARRDVVDAAVHAGAVGPVVVLHRREHRLGRLGRRRRVEIRQPTGQRRERGRGDGHAAASTSSRIDA